MLLSGLLWKGELLGLFCLLRFRLLVASVCSAWRFCEEAGHSIDGFKVYIQCSIRNYDIPSNKLGIYSYPPKFLQHKVSDDYAKPIFPINHNIHT